MEWIVTTARTVEEAQSRALDLLGVDQDDAEIQVIEEGKTGLFGRTKSEARVRARIKPKAPPVKEERRGGGRNDRNRNRNRGGGGGGRGQGGGNNRNRNNKGGGNNRNRNNKGDNGGDSKNDAGEAVAAGAAASASGGRGDGNNKGGGGGRGQGGGNNRNRNRNRNRGGGGGRQDGGEDRVEMPIEEQRSTLSDFVAGVASVFDDTAVVELVEEETTLIAQVTGDNPENLGRLIGNKAATLQTLEELSRTAMHRAAAGRRYHRIQVDVDGYRARRKEALARFATQIAESVAETGESKAMEPMGAADRKLVHDAVSQVSGVETVSEGRDPRRYIVIHPLAGAGADEEE